MITLPASSNSGKGEMTSPYNSSTLVPSESLDRFKRRAAALRVGTLSLAKQVLALAEEGGYLPDSLESQDEGKGEARFRFALPADFVRELGGEDRARELLRWAIVEGLDKSPLAPPGG